MHRLYSFGFNAFQQTDEKSNLTCTKTAQCHIQINALLYASWETTILLNDANQLIVWGFKPTWFESLASAAKGKRLTSIFGDPDTLLGFIDHEQKLTLISATLTLRDCLSQIQQAAYCKSQDALFVLNTKGNVHQYNTVEEGINTKGVLLPFPKVHAVAAAQTHVLFLTCSNEAPVYGLGSNRFSQVGMDYQQQLIATPTMVEYFCGLSDASCVACGPFHSAVILAGDLYTFGWDNEGRLGCGENDEEEIVKLAVFLDVNDQPEEVNAVKVVCGSAHTVVLDDQGTIWSCGSNKYSQLGRALTDNVDYDPYFRQCTLLFDTRVEKAIDCYAGRWATFVATTIID